MARKRHTAEEIVAKLRQVDVLVAQGRQVADAVRAIGVTEVTYYRWRNDRTWHLRKKGMPGSGTASIDAAKDSDDTR
jgi:predicted RNase H-like nuclease